MKKIVFLFLALSFYITGCQPKQTTQETIITGPKQEKFKVAIFSPIATRWASSGP